MWEEVGYYNGFALFWKACLDAKPDSGWEPIPGFYQSSTSDIFSRRASHHTRQLLEAITKFPLVNPSSLSQRPVGVQPDDSAPVDMMKLLTQIRIRYKALCSTLGVKPRLQPALASNPLETQGQTNIAEGEIPPRTRNKIWEVKKARDFDDF